MSEAQAIDDKKPLPASPETLALMVQKPAPQAAPAPLREPELNLDGLPDQEVDDTAYNAALAKRIKTYNSAMRAYERAYSMVAKALRERTEPELKARYAEAYPAYIKSEAKVRSAAMIATERMARRGQDARDLMQRDPDEFFRRVNEVYDREFGAPGAPETTQETTTMPQDHDDRAALGQRAWTEFATRHPDLARDESACREAAAQYAREASAQGKTYEDICGALPDEMARRLRQDAAEADEGRTAGMFGGQEAGNKPTGSAPQQPTTLVGELEALQRSMWGPKA